MSPSSAKEKKEGPAMMMWSNTRMSRTRPASMAFLVNAWSAELGFKLPLGWLWYSMMAGAMDSKACL